MIEIPPKITEEQLITAVYDKSNYEIDSLVAKINDEYKYWSEIKYEKLPAGITSPSNLWARVKYIRKSNGINIWRRYGVNSMITNYMQRACHQFDMNFGGSWGSSSIIPSSNKEQYLISSLMEEAISSSQMEGASTTRKVAKEMLRKKISPKGKSQQMIYNNYQTIQFIIANKDKALSEELLLTIHSLMCDGALDNEDGVGRFRTDDNVVVANGITNEVVHTPPSYQDINIFIKDLCYFFNSKDSGVFIHPIIKGIIIHFMMGYMHPFIDGNGRTARALFYWYMLKEGYWLTEYLSISRIISRSKKQYEKAFLYSEADENDIGYFIAYNLKVLDKAFTELKEYINRKVEESNNASQYLKFGNINERQAMIIKMFVDNPNLMITVKDIQSKFLVSPTTAKSDILGLIKRELLEELELNKVKRGYIRGKKL